MADEGELMLDCGRSDPCVFSCQSSPFFLRVGHEHGPYLQRLLVGIDQKKSAQSCLKVSDPLQSPSVQIGALEGFCMSLEADGVFVTAQVAPVKSQERLLLCGDRPEETNDVAVQQQEAQGEPRSSLASIASSIEK